MISKHLALPRRPGRFASIFCLALALAACSPALDWREVRPAGSGILAVFPCKPQINARPATAAEPSSMGLAECKASDLSFSLAWAELPDPQLVTPALLQMRQSLAGKLHAEVAASQPVSVPGMTPNPEAQVQTLVGGSQQARMAVFSRGLRVYQVVMLGKKGGEEAWDGFLSSLKLDE
ncbi:hypothetical protein WG899_10845 [Paucibacter sp. AS339]|uniref:hypothetical protein n=1 Tax=Paucibacter hankyongi TaxID=3133434 RepID=UPI0030A627E6